MRLSGPRFVILLGLLGLGIVVATDQIVPATSAYQAQMRVWLAARAAGIVAYLLLTGQIVFGLILSHPTNQSTWKLSKRLFPWHENLWVFVLAFLGVHIVSLILDPYAGVGVAGTFIPGLSSYRSSPVALGTLAMYALILTGAHRPLHEAPAAGVLAQAPPASASSCSSSPGSTGSWPGPTPMALRPIYICDRPGRPCGGGLSLLGQSQGAADVLHLPPRGTDLPPAGTTQGGDHEMISHPTMTTRLLVRRIAIIAAVVLSLALAGLAVRAAAAWTAASAPLDRTAGLGQDPDPAAQRRAGPIGLARGPAQRADRTSRPT